MGLHVYDARLWLPGPPSPVNATQPAPPLALELQYARALSGQRIAERSLDEMRRQGALSSEVAHAWLAHMRAVFPDVVAGDRLCGVQRSDGATLFLHNDNAKGDVTDPAFGARFFGIWLSAQTSQPGLRRQLLGLPA
ncbi:MAG: chalcone isomerase family protein [Aquabacterium sp.]